MASIGTLNYKPTLDFDFIFWVFILIEQLKLPIMKFLVFDILVLYSSLVPIKIVLRWVLIGIR